MKIRFVAATAISACLASFPALAQLHEPSMPSHAFNPSESLSAPTNSPFADQTRQDYESQLSGAQRELLQQNPAGDTRQEEEMGRELNGYVAPR
jgi:photosystem II stability/assembly factor-like uncharacterized protein